MGAAVKEFRYWRDPLFLIAVGGYALNRWALKPWVDSSFLHGQFNDLLLIPAALPVLLWCQRRIGVRDHDRSPTGMEIALHLGVWSVVCEWVGPVLLGRGTSDPWDVVVYTLGAIGAGCWWNRNRLKEAVV